jgi:hypothetical protein
MADVKISGLPAATTPLAGTEVLPIVQSGTTKKATVASILNGLPIGASTASTGAFTTLSASGTSTLAAVNSGALAVTGAITANSAAATAPFIASINGGEAMRIDSSGNLLVGTTTVAGSASNNGLIVGGGFKTHTASVSTANGTASNVITLPGYVAFYFVSAYIIADDAVNYSATNLIMTQSATSVVNTTIKAGGLLTITTSGNNIQVTQSSGATALVYCTITRIA